MLFHLRVFYLISYRVQYIGAIVAAWATYGTFHIDNNWSWRIPTLLQALVSVFQVICVYLMPESPRWLVANGRSDEATKVLCKHHSGTEEPTDLVRLQMAEITSAIEFERSLESVSYLQFFRTSKSRAHAPECSKLRWQRDANTCHLQRETVIA